LSVCYERQFNRMISSCHYFFTIGCGVRSSSSAWRHGTC
jgi:hypothetical protein